jgi:type III pantothenate kinase
MVVLFADAGNSRIKIYNSKHLALSCGYADLENRLDAVFNKYKPETIVTSCVNKSVLIQLKKKCKVIELGREHFKSFILDIKNPETVGVDRLLNIESALCRGVKPNFAVLDAGTAITLDVAVSEKKGVSFKGGLIIPGFKSQEKILLLDTRIPDYSSQDKNTGIIGRNTKQSVENGIHNCLIYGVRGIISELHKHHKIDTLVITGGDGKLFFESSIFHEILNDINCFLDEQLVLHGFLFLAKQMKLV